MLRAEQEPGGKTEIVNIRLGTFDRLIYADNQGFSRQVHSCNSRVIKWFDEQDRGSLVEVTVREWDQRKPRFVVDERNKIGALSMDRTGIFSQTRLSLIVERPLFDEFWRLSFSDDGSTSDIQVTFSIHSERETHSVIDFTLCEATLRPELNDDGTAPPRIHPVVTEIRRLAASAVRWKYRLIALLAIYVMSVAIVQAVHWLWY